MISSSSHLCGAPADKPSVEEYRAPNPNEGALRLVKINIKTLAKCIKQQKINILEPCIFLPAKHAKIHFGHLKCKMNLQVIASDGCGLQQSVLGEKESEGSFCLTIGGTPLSLNKGGGGSRLVQRQSAARNN